MADSPTAGARLISRDELKKLVNRFKTERGKAEEAAGSCGALISAAVEKHNLHKGAFRIMMMCIRMSGDPVKLHGFLANFDKYREDMELDKMAGDPLPLDPNVDPAVRTSAKAGSKKRKDKDADAEEGKSGTDNVASLSERRAAGNA